MKISIVTPNYNYGEFLIKAIKNVFAQTEAEDSPIVEHIVIDGGSTDNSVKYMQEWDRFIATIPEERRARYSFSWVSEKDRGQTDAINKGLRKSTGDIMCWLNSDESYKPNALKEIALAFIKYPKYDLIYGDIDFVDSQGKFLRTRYGHIYSYGVLLYYGCYIPSASAFWTRTAYEKFGELNPRIKTMMDTEYWVRMAKQGCKFKYIPKILSVFIWHDNNVSTLYKGKYKEELLQNQILYGAKFFNNMTAQIFMIRILKKYWFYYRQILRLHSTLYRFFF